MKKIVLLAIALMLLSLSIVTQFIVQANADPKTIYVDASNIGDPLEDGSLGHPFDKIQEGIDAASSGDTVFVYNGTYYENVLLNKNNLTLTGENRNTTIIDGSISGYTIHIQAVNNVNITEFTIQHGWGAPDFWCGIFVESSQDSILSRNIITLNIGEGVRLHDCIGFTISENKIINNSDWGIRLFDSSDNTVSDNIVSNNGYGIDLRHSSNSMVTNNVVTNNTGGPGIHLSCSPNCILKDNNMTGNSWNLRIEGAYIQDIDTSNTVNGKPVYYLVNQRHLVIQPSTFPDIGYLGIVGSSAITVRDLHLANNGEGILFACTSGSVIENVTVSNNLFGISLVSSDENIIVDNTISGNEHGIALFYCPNNVIHHNNFINNRHHQAYPVDLLSDVWDVGYPLGGNYWSDYTGVDVKSGPYQNETGSDGIGDTPYVIYANNIDRYPLMSMFSDFPVTWNEEMYNVTIVCNSIISAFEFDQIHNAFRFNVTGEDGTLGFCKVVIPNIVVQDLWQGNCTVLVEGKEPIIMNNWTDGAYTYIYMYFTYFHSEHEVHEVVIVPEFPTWMSMLFLLMVLTVAIVIYKRRLLKTPIQ